MIATFAAAVREEGAPHLDLLRLDPVEPDDKSIRAFQIRIHRGRFRALVIVKDRAEVMLVGPFRQGSSEEPCRAIRTSEVADLDRSLDEPLEGLLADLIEASCAK